MIKVYNKPVMILRKKLVGENSIEELAYHFKRIMNIELIVLPYSGQKIIDIIRNIIFIRKIKASVFHFISTDAYLLPFVKGRKIITYHDLGTINNSRNKLYRFVRRCLFIYPSKHFAHEITFVSKESECEYLKFVKPKSNDNFHVIYNPYDERLKYFETEANSKFTILHIGTAERKNLVSTIKACKNLDIKLNIIGKLNAEQLQTLEDCGTEYDNFYDISYEEVIRYYANCDIVSFPSSYEGFGLPIIEANVMRKPIFVGDIPILHEVANDSALFVDPKDIGSVRNAIVSLKQNKELRDILIEKGLKNIIRFQQNTIKEQYEKLYNVNL